MTTESEFYGAPRANITGLGPWESRVAELVLPKSVKSSNLGSATVAICWTSDG